MKDFLSSILTSETMENPIFLCLGTLISEDLAFLYGLFALKSEALSPLSFILFYSLGILLGDLMLYGFGVIARRYKDTRLGRFVVNKFPPKENSSLNEFGRFEEFLVLTRFIPGSRIPTYMYCGMTSYSVLNFSLILLIPTLLYAGIASSLILLTESFNLGEASLFIRFVTVAGIALVTINLFKFAVFCKKLKRKYGHVLRPLKILILRNRYAEFWNPFLFYLPFAPYFLYLLIRYRGFRAVLNSNPSIKMSGLVGELKSEIDALLKKYTNGNYVPLKKYQRGMNLTFPLVAKPDSGMRGTGVEVIYSEEELERYLSSSPKQVVIQDFIPYKNEWGVFYYRYPGEEKGKVFSITNKDFPVVIGDGERNLFELVLQVEDYKNRFNWIFSDENLDPYFIPNKGERVELVKRGSHSKGCIFRDGKSFVEEDYLDSVSAVFDKIPGFFVGRVDIRFKDIKELSQGKFKIIEVNGAGGESSNFYDPQMSKKELYQIMKRQWELIFKIGNINQQRTKKSISTFSFLKAAYSYRKEN